MTSQAEKWRAHRKAFELALELGCTPREAEAEMRRIEARERDRAASDRLAQKMAGASEPQTLPAERRDEPWMMRD